MKSINRRLFLQQAALATAGLAVSSNLLANQGSNRKLCFSTLGCPDWTFDQILKFAVDYKYQGLEIRTIQREIDIAKINEFQKANISSTKQKLADNNVSLVDLGSSATMHYADQPTRKKNLDDAKRYIDLASALGCPFIRVFPNNLPKDDTKRSVLDLIAAGLNDLGSYAKGSNVRVLMETHGDVVSTADLVYIMKDTDTQNTGLVWDILNAWSVTKEDPSMIYQAIKKYIYHVHVKDGIVNGGKVSYTLLGKGQAPVRQSIRLLQEGGYQGYYSFEWEKLWHPEIEEPEVALAQYPAEILRYFV